MEQLKIAVLMPNDEIRRSFFNEEACRELEELGTVYWNHSREHYSEKELKQLLPGMDVVITGWGCRALTEDVLRSADCLKILAHTGGSVSFVAPPAVYDNGIRVLSGNEVYALSVAEGAIAYMLLALRRIPEYLEEMKEQGWRSDAYYNQGLLGAEVGIIGFGAIAGHLVRLLKPFGVHLKVCSGHMSAQDLKAIGAEKVKLEEIFRCRVVSLHGAGGSQCRIGKEFINQMRDFSVLINTARGDLLDEEALAEVLASRPRLRAVLDVFAEEPLPPDSPLRQLRNVYLMPHMAGPTVDRRPLVTMGLIRDIKALQRGEAAELEIKAERAKFMSRT